MKKPILFLFMVIICFSSLNAQKLHDEFWEQTLDEWHTGDFISALEDFKKILNSPNIDFYFRDIALLTGEFSKSSEISKDGRSIKFSPAGQFVTYETEENGVILTHIFSIKNFLEQSKFVGKNAVISPDEKEIAFLRIQDTADVKKKRKEFEEFMKESKERRAIFNKRSEVAWLEALNTKIILRNLGTGHEKLLSAGDLLKVSMVFNGDGSELFFVGGAVDSAVQSDIYSIHTKSNTLNKLTVGAGFKTSPIFPKGGEYLIYTLTKRSPLPQPPNSESGSPSRRGGSSSDEFVVFNLNTKAEIKIKGSNPTVSLDGSTLAYIVSENNSTEIFTSSLKEVTHTQSVKKTSEQIESIGLSPNGENVVFSMMFRRNFDVFLAKVNGKEVINVSKEIQHDRFPQFISNTKVLYAKGEGRHLRSYIYDLENSTTTKLFHNNSIRTIAPEYNWAINSDGTKLLIQADRDGDTISPEQSVHLIDLNQTISKQELLDRIDKNLQAEQKLRDKGKRMFRPILHSVQNIVDRVSIRKIYEYEEALFQFDSKYVTEPGNRPAGDYIYNLFESFGYQPEYQWVKARNDSSANILATLTGAENPELIYVLSSHYDSNRRGPGADDNTSAIAVLLETARLLKNHPLPATVIFAAFTGEEAGLLGSRHFVQEAKKNNLRLMGAINNDMIGWTNDFHLDNTIRYSNAGIRDVQHAGAFLFSKMITYDAHYYKSTDAAAYYEEYGDIVGGIGSYPVLGNPYYHQATDLLETVNHQLLYEATKANIASLMLLASSPSRVKELAACTKNNEIEVSWRSSPEKSVTHYYVRYGDGEFTEVKTAEQAKVNIKLNRHYQGKPIHVAVKAANSKGLESWDWAKVLAVTK